MHRKLKFAPLRNSQTNSMGSSMMNIPVLANVQPNQLLSCSRRKTRLFLLAKAGTLVSANQCQIFDVRRATRVNTCSLSRTYRRSGSFQPQASARVIQQATQEVVFAITWSEISRPLSLAPREEIGRNSPYKYNSRLDLQMHRALISQSLMKAMPLTQALLPLVKTMLQVHF